MPDQTAAPPADTLWMERSGLIWAHLFDASGHARAIDGEEATAALAALAAPEARLWLHFDLVDPRARARISAMRHLPPGVVELLLGAEERQQIELHDGVVAGVIADFESDEDPDPRHMIYWRFAMTPHALITVRRRPSRTLRDVNAALGGPALVPSIPALVLRILERFVQVLVSVGRDLSGRLDAVEDDLLDDRDGSDFQALGAVRRSSVRLHRQIRPLCAALHGLVTDRPAWFTDEDVEACDRVAARLDNGSSDLSALQERAHALQDELTARQIEQTNRRVMVISVISAVLLPPTLISGIFGMNVGGLPFTENHAGFVYAMALIAISICGLLLLLRRMRVA